jgi:hypothetical protein
MVRSAILILVAVFLQGGVFGLDMSEYGGPSSVTPVASEAPAAILPSQTNVCLLSVCDEWAVWRRSHLIENTRHNRKQSFDHAYYLQRLTEEQARLFHTEVGGWGVPSLAVTKDGAIALAGNGKVAWHCVRGATARTLPEYSIAFIRGVYPDGILVQPPGGIRKPDPPVTFIPFRGHDLDEAAGIEVVPAGVRAFFLNTIFEIDIARHKSVFAWSTDNAIHFFDLTSGKRWQVKLTYFYPPRWVTAFDSETVVTRNYFAFDARTGAFLGEKDCSKRWNAIREPIFFVRNRIGYWIEDGQLRATDLTSSPIRTVSLRENVHEPIGQSAAGLILWTGNDWERLPWLEELPATDSPKSRESLDDGQGIGANIGQ